jgi:hypothetical protein
MWLTAAWPKAPHDEVQPLPGSFYPAAFSLLGLHLARSSQQPCPYPFRCLPEAEDELGEVVVFSVEVGHRHGKLGGKSAGKRIVNLVHTQFVSVDARAGDEVVEARCDPECLLRQARTKPGLFESASEYGVSC